MNFKDSSEEEEDDIRHNVPAFSKFDESIGVKNTEEISNKNAGQKKLKKYNSNKSESNDELDVTSPHSKHNEFTRYSTHENDFKSMGIGSDPSDSEESDEDDIQGSDRTNKVECYNPKDYENLKVSSEIKELFQNIMRYTPQKKIGLNYKLIPFIPEYIPAVGDIDAFIKIPRPDGVVDKVGLVVLDEPSTDQSDPAVLHLQLRSQSKSAGTTKQTVIKRIEDAEKNTKSIDKWIDDINQLQRSKHFPSIQLSKPMPDIDNLMQQWPSNVQEKLIDLDIDFTKLDCDISQMVDIVCNIFDVPVEKNSRIEALHILFTLYLEARDIKSHRF